MNKTAKIAHIVAIAALVMCLFTLAGCQSVLAVLSEVDYACVDLQADGPWTDSGMQGRGFVLPEGVELTDELIASLCE